MEWFKLWQDDHEEISEFLQDRTTIEKMELLVALANDIVEDKKLIQRFIDHDNYFSQLYRSVEIIKSLTSTVDFLELIHIERMNKAYEVKKDMEQRGYIFN